VAKKIVTVMVLTLLTAATTARAEHKLLITDVLDQKQIEAQASLEYSHISGDFDLKGFPFDSGKVTSNVTESRYSLGVGLGYGLEMSASIPFVVSERAKAELAGESEYEKRDGFGDVTVGAKYRIFDEERLPFTLVAGVDLKFDSARRKDAGTGTFDVSPYLAASKKLTHHATPYLGYRAVVRNHDAADSHILTLGLEQEFSEMMTLDVRGDASFNTATDFATSSQNYSVEAAAYVQVYHNLYLIPSVALLAISPADIKGADIHVATAVGVRGGLSLYYLY
jgi:hypothetical protein